jgi:queuine/archaeosine tRNA-ribosyltransferase
MAKYRNNPLNNDSTNFVLNTRHGEIKLPAYIPVTTFGYKYPLDDLIRPYLRRLAPAVMCSLHYAKQMTERPNVPMLIDSGGFASLFKNATIKKKGEIGILELTTDSGIERTHPMDVLDFQEEHADVAFTLDFPIPPSTELKQAKLRLKLTILNAIWALENRRRRDMPLFACVQGWDVESYRSCATEFANAGFDGIAIGGLVPRMRDRKRLFGIIDTVREAVPHLPLHVFGLGKPELVKVLFEHGVQSVDSSSYVKLAAKGLLWSNRNQQILQPSPTERLNLALSNLATATEVTLPLSYLLKSYNAKKSAHQFENQIAEPDTRAV